MIMSKKEAISYARALLNRGYTRDAAISIMISRGFTEKEVSKALMLAVKPEKQISITTLLFIAIALMIILVPVVIIITKDKISTNLSQTFSSSFAFVFIIN